jgi:non-ribosomal peptide synthetase component F
VLRIASHFENLLRHAVSNPETRLSSLPMLSDEERRKQEQEVAERKQSQRKKLMSAAPKPVDLASADAEKKTP